MASMAVSVDIDNVRSHGPTGESESILPYTCTLCCSDLVMTGDITILLELWRSDRHECCCDEVNVGLHLGSSGRDLSWRCAEMTTPCLQAQRLLQLFRGRC